MNWPLTVLLHRLPHLFHERSKCERSSNQLDREIKAVSGWWEGDSVKAFTEEFDALKPSLDKLVECVHGISKQFCEVTNAKEESEKNCKCSSQLNRMSSKADRISVRLVEHY